MNTPRSIRTLARDERGAVFVEFLAVFFPLMGAFLSLTQLAFMYTANMVVQHAAMKAVRVAAVVLHDDPALYGGAALNSATGERLTTIEKAAKTQTALIGDAKGTTVKLDQTSYRPDQMINLTVEYQYECSVPLGSLVACGLDGTKKLTGNASLPNQGAEFTYQ